MGPEALKQKLVETARALGFAECRVAAARPAAHRALLEQWVAEGKHGDMAWMETRAEVRRGPQSLWPEAKSVIALGMSYAPALDPLALEGHGSDSAPFAWEPSPVSVEGSTFFNSTTIPIVSTLD